MKRLLGTEGLLVVVDDVRIQLVIHERHHYGTDVDDQHRLAGSVDHIRDAAGRMAGSQDHFQRGSTELDRVAVPELAIYMKRREQILAADVRIRFSSGLKNGCVQLGRIYLRAA